MSTLDVTGWTVLQRRRLFKALWHAQVSASFFGSVGSPSLADDSIDAALSSKSGVDYVSGRAMKTRLDGDHWDMTLYDRDATVPARETYAVVKHSLGLEK